MAGKCERVGPVEGIFRSVQVWRGEPGDVFSAAQSKLSDQRHAGNVRELIEIVTVDPGQLGSELSAGPPKTSIDFLVRLRCWNFLRQRLQYASAAVQTPCGYPARARDNILRQRVGQAKILRAQND